MIITYILLGIGIPSFPFSEVKKDPQNGWLQAKDQEEEERRKRREEEGKTEMNEIMDRGSVLNEVYLGAMD